MIDPSSKLIFQGALSTYYDPSSITASKSDQNISLSPPKRKKNNKGSTPPCSNYAVLYLDGRLECYKGDPFSVGSPHEASRPIHVLHLNPLLPWSLISIPSNSNSSFTFTLSRPSPPSTLQSSTLTHLGLDVEAMGYPNRSSLNDSNLKAKDRKSLKQIFGFRPKRSATLINKNTDNKLIDPIDPNPELPPLDDQSFSQIPSQLSSPPSAPSQHSSLHLSQNLPNSLTFFTHSESSRKQWITAFLSVFRLMADLESTSTNNPSSPDRSCQKSKTPIKSLHSNPSFTSQQQQQQPQHQTQTQHTSRIPLAPISSQTTHPSSQTTISTPQNSKWSPADLFSSSTRASPSHADGPIPNLSTTNNQQPPSSFPESVLNRDPSPPPSSDPLNMSCSSQTSMAVAVPAWIKAVRNADEKKHNSGGDSPSRITSLNQALSEISLAVKQKSTDSYLSGECSIDPSYLNLQQTPSSSLMSHSVSAPAPFSSISPEPITSSAGGGSAGTGNSSKPAMSASIKCFGNSVVQNLKRVGSLTEWPDHSSPSQSILQRMRESDHQSTLSDNSRPSSPPQPMSVHEGNDNRPANPKRTWLLNVVKKNSLDKVNTNFGSSPLNPSLMPTTATSPTTATTSAPRSTSRTARYGVYMLKGLSSNSSLSSSCHHFPASSRESDGQHSIHQALTQCTDSEQSDHHHQPPTSSEQQHTFPQLPQQSNHSGRRPQTGQGKKAFSDWLTTTSSQAAQRLRKPSADFKPTHQSSRSVSSARYTPLQASLGPGSSTYSLPKQHGKPRLGAQEVGLSILNHAGDGMRCSSDSLSSVGRVVPLMDRSCVTTPSEDCFSPVRSDEMSLRALETQTATGGWRSPEGVRKEGAMETGLDWLHLGGPLPPPSPVGGSANRPRTYTVSALAASSHAPLSSLPVPPARRKPGKSSATKTKQTAVLGSLSRQELVLSGLTTVPSAWPDGLPPLPQRSKPNQLDSHKPLFRAPPPTKSIASGIDGEFGSRNLS
ncbi:hypothetical protein VP01_1571g4 [Puccinia sorghi]|uniref:PH domain-containing protein n=1 Tax=Puccinia sorghi TaxID=27349 RepID=A0A0L6VIC0_9BASI|nr:hypothetical protein VP01_1571g4 [Puccinia sorghi]